MSQIALSDKVIYKKIRIFLAVLALKMNPKLYLSDVNKKMQIVDLMGRTASGGCD